MRQCAVAAAVRRPWEWWSRINVARSRAGSCVLRQPLAGISRDDRRSGDAVKAPRYIESAFSCPLCRVMIPATPRQRAERCRPAVTTAGLIQDGGGTHMIRPTIAAILMSVIFPTLGLAQTTEELKNDDKTPGDVLTYGMGYSQQRFSPLMRINRNNVKRLVPAWSYSMSDNRGQEDQPLLKDGIIYLTDHEKTVALDAISGKAIWKSMIEYPPDTTRVVCCGIVNRGGALFDGKLY